MANLTQSGTIFDVQSYSVHDGPGIRTLIFLKGCPLNCHWCANPEGQARYPELRYHDMNCAGCLSCKAVCPHDAISVKPGGERGKGFVAFDRAQCATCSEMPCVQACPNQALQKVGKSMTVADVMKLVRRDLPYYRGIGGITLSGGDPLYQLPFTLEILKACREEYVDTAIETAMLVPYHVVEEVLPYVDLFLCDIKHMDSAKHRELTGVPNEVILANIEKLAAAKPGSVLIRVPVIPDCNDTDENLAATAAFARKVGIDRINILPYHKLGQVKYEQLGMTYAMKEVNPPAPESMNRLKRVVEEQGVKCIVG